MQNHEPFHPNQSNQHVIHPIPTPNINPNFASQASQARHQQQQLDEILNQTSAPNPSNINLLSRGLQLLSINQLRQLLREYSFPTGGNKRALVQKLIMFLETIGPNQQNLLVQFSLKLKKLLSIENPTGEDHPQSEAQTSLLPPDISDKLIQHPPSILFQNPDRPPIFGPLMIRPNFPSEMQEIPNTGYNGYVPIFQIASVFPDQPLKNVILLINERYYTLTDQRLWFQLPTTSSKSISFVVQSVEPANIPIIAVVRPLKRTPIVTLIDEIIEKGPPQPVTYDKPLSGICRYTKKVLQQPARGVNCTHPDCFDISGFIAFASKFERWECPICQKPLQVEDLRIDYEYLVHVKN